jgi:beta-barrel assembly-enhancing protease
MDGHLTWYRSRVGAAGAICLLAVCGSYGYATGAGPEVATPRHGTAPESGCGGSADLTIDAHMRRLFGSWESPAQAEHVRRTAQDILAVSRISTQTWAFTLLDDAKANAFVAGNGVVYLTRGLLNALLDNDELAAVIAHEIAHVELGHLHDGRPMQEPSAGKAAVFHVWSQGLHGARLNEREVRELVTQRPPERARLEALTRPPATDEFAADQRAVELLRAAGKPPTAMLRALQRLAVAAGVDSGHGRVQPAGSATHPGFAARMARLQAAMVSRP